MAAIEKDIQKHALGMDIGYKPGHLDTVAKISCGVAIKDLENSFKYPISQDFPKAIAYFSQMSDKAKAEGEMGISKALNWQVSHMQRLKDADTSHVDFTVYKYNYTTNNVFNPKGPRTEVNQYYFFDYNDSLIGFESPEIIDHLIQGQGLSAPQAYELAMMHVQAGVPYY